MLGKVSRTKGVRTTLRYSELKVAEHKAVYLLAENFVKRTEDLTFGDKIDRLQQLAALNERGQFKFAHIFLNFHRDDKLSDQDLIDIAKRYMEHAGFGRQPYLVYRHDDAWHPHLHAVSTFVTADRKMIETRRPRLLELLELTKDLEKEYSLKKNHRFSDEELNALQVVSAQHVTYGKSSLVRAIGDVINTVIDHYKYTSLNDLNAILGQYNVKAKRGNEGTRLYENGGLVYVPLDDKGRQIARGIKAGDFNLKPTLAYLETKFAQNEILLEKSHERISMIIDWTLDGRSMTWARFQESMAKEGINVLVSQEKGKSSGDVYFVDHRDKLVLPGGRMGDRYSLAALQERCAQEQLQEEVQRQQLRLHI